MPRKATGNPPGRPATVRIDGRAARGVLLAAEKRWMLAEALFSQASEANAERARQEMERKRSSVRAAKDALAEAAVALARLTGWREAQATLIAIADTAQQWIEDKPVMGRPKKPGPTLEEEQVAATIRAVQAQHPDVSKGAIIGEMAQLVLSGRIPLGRQLQTLATAKQRVRRALARVSLTGT